MTERNTKESRKWLVVKIVNTNIINNVIFYILTNFTNGILFVIFGGERIPAHSEGN